MSAIVPSQPVSREFMERPKARFFGFLSLIWGGLMVSGPVLIEIGPYSLASENYSAETEWFRTLAWCLLASEIVFILLAVAFWRFEKPRRVVRKVFHDWCWGPIIR